MGALFTHQALAAEWGALQSFLTAHEIPLWSADVSGTPLTAGAPSRVALAVGNEGGGVSAPVRERSERIISVPIERGVESLNVAVATGILLYVLK